MSIVNTLRTSLTTLAASLALVLVVAGRDVSADNTPTPTNVPVATPTLEPGSTSYQARSFDEVKPANIDLELVPAPGLPEFPACSGDPRNVRVTLETKEYEAEIAPGITYPFLSFNGAVPGPAIVVCLGDWVEVTLKNPADSKHAHNIDFHAATGELGGGAASIASPGKQTTFRFQTLHGMGSAE